MLFWLSMGTVFASSAEEFAVRAAFVYNFAVFTEWPDTAFDGPEGECRLCVIGEEPLESAFKTIAGKSIGNRPLRIRYMRKAENLDKCDIAFIGRDVDHAALLRILAAVRGRPALTISEKKDFARIGGVINLFVKNGRLGFEINPAAARRQTLNISSRLLKLAVIVEDK